MKYNYIPSVFYDVFDLGYTPRIEEKEGKISVFLPGVGKKNIQVSEVRGKILVEWKENGQEFKKIFHKTGNGDTEAEYIDGVLSLSNSDMREEPKKLEIK